MKLEMRIFELEVEGRLTREMIREFGDTLTMNERIKLGSYGLGHLRLKDGSALLLTLYEQENHTIKTHFDWTAKGAVIRMRTFKKIYAIGIKDEQIKNVGLTKTEDYIYAIPFTPFWFLMKWGVRPSIAKWFAIRPEKFQFGPVFIDLNLHDYSQLKYEVPGDLWSDSLSTFGRDKIRDRISVVDRRTAVDDMGSRQGSA